MYKFPNLFTLERSSQVQHLFLLSLRDLGFTLGGLRQWNHMTLGAHTGSCWGLLQPLGGPSLPNCSVKAASTLPFPLSFTDKLHLPVNIILHPEDCQNSHSA